MHAVTTRLLMMLVLLLTVSALMPAWAGPAGASAKAAATKTTAAKAGDPLKGLARNYDKMRGVAWYQSRTSPKYRNSNGLYLYFGKYDDGTFTPLRLAIQYAADDWLFVTRAWAKADKADVELPQKRGTFAGWERDNSGGGIWEWSDEVVSGAGEVAAVRRLASAKRVTVRYEGQQYYNDRTLSSKQLAALREVIAAYEAATGRPWQ